MRLWLPIADQSEYQMNFRGSQVPAQCHEVAEQSFETMIRDQGRDYTGHESTKSRDSIVMLSNAALDCPSMLLTTLQLAREQCLALFILLEPLHGVLSNNVAFPCKDDSK